MTRDKKEDWDIYNLPMYNREDELEHFSVENNDMVFWTCWRNQSSINLPRQKRKPTQYSYVSFKFKTRMPDVVCKVHKFSDLRVTPTIVSLEKFQKAVLKIFEYIQMKPMECDRLLLQYWRYFDDLKCEYKKIFYLEINEFLNKLASDSRTAYEKKKKDRLFLANLTKHYRSSQGRKNIGYPLFLPPYVDVDCDAMQRFDQEFNYPTYLTRLSAVLTKNKYIFFDAVNARDINEPSITEELNKRTLIFQNITKCLQDYTYVSDHEDHLIRLVYSSDHFSDHYLIMFEAIEQFWLKTGGTKFALNAVENVIYHFPEFVLYLFSDDDIETFDDDVGRLNSMFIEANNRVLQRIENVVTRYLTWPGSKTPGELHKLQSSSKLHLPISTGLSVPAVRNHLFIGGEDIVNPSRSQRNRGNFHDSHADTVHFPININGFNSAWSFTTFTAECWQDEFPASVHPKDLRTRRFLNGSKLPIKKEIDHPQAEERKIYYLLRFLRGCFPVRTLFNEPGNNYQQVLQIAQLCTEIRISGTKWGQKLEAVSVFLKVIDGMVTFPTLRIYYHLLKEFLTNESKQKIENRLKQRKAADKWVMEFLQRPAEDVNKDFEEHTKRMPLAFYLCFVISFTIATTQKDSRKQIIILQQFCKALLEMPILRKLVDDDSKKKEVFEFREKLDELLNSAPDSVPEQAKTMFKKPLSEMLAAYRWKADISQYPKSSLINISEKPLGGGNQASAVLVRAPQFPMPLVAKYFDTTQEETVAEIECLVKMQFNPHVVQIFGYIVDKENYIGILMEYCRGGSLDMVIEKAAINILGSYTEVDIVRWAAQAASGLNYLHGKGLLHRDVKPANMLLDGDHHILKIGDLGISKILPEEQRFGGDFNFARTGGFGTPGYSPPDFDDSYSASVDVFSLGRSVWQMIVKKCPTEELLLESKTKKRPRIVSEAVWDFVFKMMHKTKEMRPSMEECYTFFQEKLPKLPEPSFSKEQPVRNPHSQKDNQSKRRQSS